MNGDVAWYAVLRDIEERGRDLESILRQYVQFVKPSFEDFILPVCGGLKTIGTFSDSVKRGMWIMSLSLLSQTKKYADVIIPRGADNLGTYNHVRPQYYHKPKLTAAVVASAVAIDLIVQHIREVYASHSREIADNRSIPHATHLDKPHHTPSLRPH